MSLFHSSIIYPLVSCRLLTRNGELDLKNWLKLPLERSQVLQVPDSLENFPDIHEKLLSALSCLNVEMSTEDENKKASFVVLDDEDQDSEAVFLIEVDERYVCKILFACAYSIIFLVLMLCYFTAVTS